LGNLGLARGGSTRTTTQQGRRGRGEKESTMGEAEGGSEETSLQWSKCEKALRTTAGENAQKMGRWERAGDYGQILPLGVSWPGILEDTCLDGVQKVAPQKKGGD
jgi:hypothetical protein